MSADERMQWRWCVEEYPTTGPRRDWLWVMGIDPEDGHCVSLFTANRDTADAIVREHNEALERRLRAETNGRLLKAASGEPANTAYGCERHQYIDVTKRTRVGWRLILALARYRVLWSSVRICFSRDLSRVEHIGGLTGVVARRKGASKSQERD